MSIDFRSVRKILWADWDPIGCGVPPDEYDDHVPGVMRLLIERKPREMVAHYLRVTAADTIGCPVSDEKLTEVVNQLMALGVGDGGGT